MSESDPTPPSDIRAIAAEAGWTDATLLALLIEYAQQRGHADDLAAWLRDRHDFECVLPTMFIT